MGLICIYSNLVHSVTLQLPPGVWQEQAQTLTSFSHVAVTDKGTVLSKWKLCWILGSYTVGFERTVHDNKLFSLTKSVTRTLQLYYLNTLKHFSQPTTMSDGIKPHLC